MRDIIWSSSRILLFMGDCFLLMQSLCQITLQFRFNFLKSLSPSFIMMLWQQEQGRKYTLNSNITEIRIFSINNVSKPGGLDERENLKICCTVFKISWAHTWNTIITIFFMILWWEAVEGAAIHGNMGPHLPISPTWKYFIFFKGRVNSKRWLILPLYQNSFKALITATRCDDWIQTRFKLSL